MSLRENKSWQFLCGCFTLLLVWKLHSLGVFAWIFTTKPEGFESVSVIPLVLTAVVSAVQMVGLIAIMIVGFMAPTAEWAVDRLRALLPKFNAVASKIEDRVDVDKLTKTLNAIDERIRSIEIKIGDND